MASAVICAHMAEGQEHRRCSKAGRHLVKRSESLFMMRHLFAMHAIIRAIDKSNDGTTCTIDDALAICGEDMSRQQLIQSLRCLGRVPNRKTYTGGFFEITGDQIVISSECAAAYAIDQNVAALRTFARLRDQFSTLNERAIYVFVVDHQLASERLALQLHLTTWRQYAIVFYLSYRHHLGDQFVPLADVARHLDVDSKRVTLAIDQMFVDTAKQICKRHSVSDERVIELSLTDRLSDRIDEFHARFDGFFPKKLTLSMFKEKKLKVESFHSQTKFDEVSFSSNYMDSLA